MATLDTPSIDTIIDKRKLLLGQLCRLPCEYLAKKSISSSHTIERGYIPDVVICTKVAWLMF